MKAIFMQADYLQKSAVEQTGKREGRTRLLESFHKRSSFSLEYNEAF